MRLPLGFRAAGVQAGLKPSGRSDLALIASGIPCAWAFAGTRNSAAAACVQRARRLYALGGPLHGLVVNAGNANCATGEPGLQADVRMAELAARELKLATESVLTASTGVIGHLLPVDKIERVMPGLYAGLEFELEPAANAILTTDLTQKIAEASLSNGARVVGFAKGSGMIHPNMATMLAFVLTDAWIDQHVLRETFPAIVARTFNAVTVDGDTSTNDMAVVLANGAAGSPEKPLSLEEIESFHRENSEEFARQTHEALKAIETVMRTLARMIARDGEGATKLLTVRLIGAQDESAALHGARTIAGSSLLKAAVYGNDPNWGRVIAALGRSGIHFDPTKTTIAMQNVPVFDGAPLLFDRAGLSALMRQEEVVIEVNIHNGTFLGEAWGCDLTEGYVRINAEYTT